MSSSRGTASTNTDMSWFHKNVGMDESIPERAKDIIDGAWLHQRLRTDSDISDQELEKAFFADTSQCMTRKPWAYHDLPTLTTSSTIWSYSRKRYMLAEEHLRTLGFGDVPGCLTLDMKGMSQAALKSLSGEGMALPCIGMILGAMAVFLPGKFEEAAIV